MTLKEYTVTINGVEHTMQLDEDDAKRYGDRAKEVQAKARTPQNKAATASTKES